MLVTPNMVGGVLKHITEQHFISLDTETTGLRPFLGDRLFSVIIATYKDVFYFDFNSYNRQPTLSKSIIPYMLTNFCGCIFLHNAKFDMHMMYEDGLDLTHYNIHCTEAIGRLVRNNLFKYSLDALTGEKSDEVKKYCDKNKLYTKDEDGDKLYHYEQVPLEIMQPYAEIDARITRNLGISQIESLTEQQAKIDSLTDRHLSKHTLLTLMEQEKRLTKALFRMERKGVRVNIPYIKAAKEYETQNYQNAAREFQEISGVEFKDSNKVLAGAFTNAGEKFPTTEKGNPSFADEVLERMTSPLAKLVQEHRRAYMMANTFFSGFLKYKDANDIIHPNFKQGGARTGRMSCKEPNLQNVPKKDEDHSQYPVRNCFLAEPEYYWFSIDWKAMEYRLMLDLAGEMSLIQKIMDGHDVHQATGDLIHLKRDIAKNVNFALLYGTGNAHLGVMIKRSTEDAKKIRSIYYSELPNVASLIETVKKVAERRKYIINPFGRRLLFPIKDYSYQAPNYLIQGGCGDIMKKSLVDMDEFLMGKKSYLFLTVHDEAGIMIHKSELDIIPELKRIMENAYTHKYLPMAVDVEYSDTNWGELKEWRPNAGE